MSNAFYRRRADAPATLERDETTMNARALRAAFVLAGLGCVALPRGASAQATPQQLVACVIPGTGTLYLPNGGAPGPCVRPEHVQVRFAVSGATGATGPTGATGAAGPQGPT